MDFSRVFAYAPGKADWMAYGLPVERGPGMPPIIGDFLEREVPCCRQGELIGDARQAAYEMGLDMCPVVTDGGILIGLCTRNSLHAHPSICVDLVMEPGPLTARPSMPVHEALEIIERQKIRSLLVTTPDGKLIGQFNRRAAARANRGDGKALAT